jgi:hypothetical protein
VDQDRRPDPQPQQKSEDFIHATLDDDTPALKSLREVADRFETTIEPVFGGANDPELASYFRAGLADDAADALVTELRTLDFVESAYAKPLATLPTTPNNP